MELNNRAICILDEASLGLLSGANLSFDGRYVRAYWPRQKQWEYLHRLIAGIDVSGKKIVVDHINRNRLDNRNENLRIVSQALNVLNCKHRKSKSGVTGVFHIPYKKSRGKMCKVAKPWRVEIKKNGIKYGLGYFSSKEEARSAYLAKRKELFGE